MKRIEIAPDGDFEVLAGTERSQAATMVIAPGDAEGGRDNRHPRSDQWLYVVSGRGRARVEDVEVTLGPGVLLMIERGERHEIRCEGDEPLRTFNIYALPAYDYEGEALDGRPVHEP